MWAPINRTIFRRTSTYALVVSLGTFLFEPLFESVTEGIFKRINKGKLWDDIKENYGA